MKRDKRMTQVSKNRERFSVRVALHGVESRAEREADAFFFCPSRLQP